MDILDCHGQNRFIHMTRYTNCSAALLVILAATVALFAASRGAERPGRPKKPGEPQGTFCIVGKSVIELCDNIYLLSNRGECKVEGEDCRRFIKDLLPYLKSEMVITEQYSTDAIEPALMMRFYRKRNPQDSELLLMLPIFDEYCVDGQKGLNAAMKLADSVVEIFERKRSSEK